MILERNIFSDEEIFELFPQVCMPEVDGLKLSITRTAIVVCGKDSNWALQSDISLAVGPGCMHFSFSGEVRIELESPQEKKIWSLAEAAQTPPPPVVDIRLVKRGSPWEFSFSAQDNVIIKIFADIGGISWKSEEE